MTFLCLCGLQSGISPLHLSILEGHQNTSKYLIEQDASVNIFSETKVTPLHMASESGQLLICKLLLAKKADHCATNEVCEHKLA